MIHLFYVGFFSVGVPSNVLCTIHLILVRLCWWFLLLLVAAVIVVVCGVSHHISRPVIGVTCWQLTGMHFTESSPT